MKPFIVLSDISGDNFPDEWYEMATEDHFWIQTRLNTFLKQLSSINISCSKPFRVLDIGCGDGILRRQLESHTDWNIDGVDINEQRLQKNRTKTGKTFLYNIHDRYPGFDKAYDIIILFDVLEHIHDTYNFLLSALYHLKQGGWLFINVPALPILYSRYDEAVGHLRRHTCQTLQRKLENVHLQVVDIRYWGLTMIPFLLLRKWLIPKHASDKTIIEYGFNYRNAFINSVFLKITKIEAALIKKPRWGTSLLAIACKRPQGKIHPCHQEET